MSASSRSWQPNKNAGVSKTRQCNDRYFVIIRLSQNLITLPTDVSKSCNLSECCLHSCNQSKRYNGPKTKTCHLPGHRPLTNMTIDSKYEHMKIIFTLIVKKPVVIVNMSISVSSQHVWITFVTFNLLTAGAAYIRFFCFSLAH